MSSRHFWLILSGFFIVRFFVVWNVGLIDDEAYHWTWAKNINYSYFDHPGFVAWAIWPFAKIFGDVEWAIRLPGLIMYCGILFTVYKLGRDLFDEQVARWSTVLMLFIPLWGFASLGTLPDMPLGLFWILITWVFWQSVRPDDKQWSTKKSWLLIGILMGLGMNSKLTCCMLGLGMGLFLVFTPRVRHHLKTPWPYLGALLTFVLMTPVFYWNSQHEWASFHYQFLARHQEARGFDFPRWLGFWGYQWLFMSLAVYAMMLVAFFKGAFTFLKSDTLSERFRFIFLLPLPALALFYYQPFFSAYKPHWSGPAYMILLFGAVKLFLSGLQIAGKIWLKPKSKFIITLGAITLLPFQLIYIPLFTPIVPQIQKKLTPDQTWNPTWDFSNEFYGWEEIGQKMKEVREEYLATQPEKKIHFAGQRYELISQLTWGTKEKVWQLCNERDQFKYDQPDSEKQKLFGDDFIVVNNDKYPRDPMELVKFDSCTKSEFPFYRKSFSGETVLSRTFYIYICKNFQGVK